MKASYRAGRALARAILVLLGARWSGGGRVPRTGKLVVAPNHRSYLDPPLVGCGVERELHFFAKKELFDVPVLGWVIRHVFNSIPIRRGAADRRALARAIEALEEGEALVLFPEGTRAKPGRFREPKLGVSMVVAHTGAPVVPVRIEGTGGGLRGLVRSALRIERIRVEYGEPIDPSDVVSARGTEGYEAAAARVMNAIRALGEGETARPALEEGEEDPAPGSGATER